MSKSTKKIFNVLSDQSVDCMGLRCFVRGPLNFILIALGSLAILLLNSSCLQQKGMRAAGWEEIESRSQHPTPNPPPGQRVGKLTPITIEGLAFETTSGIKGFTNPNGEFGYNDNDTVHFFLGSKELGKATGAQEVSLGNLFSLPKQEPPFYKSFIILPLRWSLESQIATHYFRIMLSLDPNGITDNKITIPRSQHELLVQHPDIQEPNIDQESGQVFFGFSDLMRNLLHLGFSAQPTPTYAVVSFLYNQGLFKGPQFCRTRWEETSSLPDDPGQTQTKVTKYKYDALGVLTGVETTDAVSGQILSKWQENTSSNSSGHWRREKQHDLDGDGLFDLTTESEFSDNFLRYVSTQVYNFEEETIGKKEILYDPTTLKQISETEFTILKDGSMRSKSYTEFEHRPNGDQLTTRYYDAEADSDFESKTITLRKANSLHKLEEEIFIDWDNNDNFVLATKSIYDPTTGSILRRSTDQDQNGVFDSDKDYQDTFQYNSHGDLIRHHRRKIVDTGFFKTSTYEHQYSTQGKKTETKHYVESDSSPERFLQDHTTRSYNLNGKEEFYERKSFQSDGAGGAKLEFSTKVYTSYLNTGTLAKREYETIQHIGDLSNRETRTLIYDTNGWLIRDLLSADYGNDPSRNRTRETHINYETCK